MFRLPFYTAVVLLLAGCGEQHFRAETTWHADGKVDRAVYQPLEFFPPESQSKWHVVRTVHEVASSAFEGSVRAVPIDRSGEARHVAAWGSFASPAEIPESIRIPGADPTTFGTLARNCTVDDLGLVDEYRWRETLTDVASLAEMASARRAFVTQIADVVEITARDGDTYKADKLIAWMRNDAARWFEELHAELVEAAIRGDLRHDPAADNSLPNRWADISARYGLNVRTRDGALLPNEALSAAIGRYLIDKVRSTVTDRDGTLLDEDQARSFLASLGITEPETGTWTSSPAIEKAISTRFDDEEAAKKTFAELVTRLVGVYQLGFFLPQRPMHFELTLPGEVVETTGERVGKQTVRWTFHAPDAFPFGYPMTARSLAPNAASQKKLFGSVRLHSLEQMSRYARLMHTDTSLRNIMQRCVTAESLKPFADFETDLKQSGTDDAVLLARVAALRKLLMPPKN